MGCDIHLYREKKVNGKWVTMDNFVKEYDDEPADVPWKERFTDRDYDLFGFLAVGVRSNHGFGFEPRGMPLDYSDEVKNLWSEYGEHTPSYLYLHELKDAWSWLQSQTVKVSGMKNKEELEALHLSILNDDHPNYDLIYPYCQWASPSLGYEEFTIDLPAHYKLSGVEKIINLFPDDDGEYRIVFWFDS